MDIERPLICGALMEETAEGFLISARLAREMGADCIEVRVDGLEEPGPSSVKELLRKVREEVALPIILTCRMAEEGGSFNGSEEERVEILGVGIPVSDLVDVELRTEEGAREGLMDLARKEGKKVICSHHNFEGTPSRDFLESIYTEEFRAGADIAKVAVTAEEPRDVLDLMEVAHGMSARGRVCAIPMGEAGKPGRMVAPFFGSIMNYGYVTRQTAPGQLSVRELRTLFDIMGL